MQFHITYNRPVKRGRKTKMIREVSGWYVAPKDSYITNIIEDYKEHGFFVYEINKSKYLFSSPSHGTRILEVR